MALYEFDPVRTVSIIITKYFKLLTNTKKTNLQFLFWTKYNAFLYTIFINCRVPYILPIVRE